LISANTNISVLRTSVSRLGIVNFDSVPFGTIFSDHVLSAQYRDGQWKDPEIAPYGPIPLAPSASGLHYGQSIFEGFKAFRLRDSGIGLFRIRDNFVRLNHSAKRLAMPELPKSLFVDGIAELIRLDQKWVPNASSGSLYVRPIYFATDEALVVRPSQTYRFAVFTCPVGKYFAEPLRLLAEERLVRAFPGGLGATKAAGNYAGSLLAGVEAAQKGFHGTLWLDGLTHRFVEECGLMNIFFVIDRAVVTPPLSGTILPGVTRDSVIVVLRDMGIGIVERPISLEEVVQASKEKRLSEAFATGTAATVAPIEVIRYRESDIRLSVEPKSLAEEIASRLESIRTGEVPDPHGWIFRI
jgi:branched-chain amino acid aminotransferase